jgi:hypothetical protein
VREMVREEQVCCGFLTFDLEERHDELLLTIKAPEEARGIASELFMHFSASNPGLSAACACVP